MQVFLIILCRKIIFWLLSSPFPILFLSFSYLQYNNKPKSQENASILNKKLLKMLTKGGKKLATNSQLSSSLLSTFHHFFPQHGISLHILYSSLFLSLQQELATATFMISLDLTPQLSHINKFLLLFIILYIYYIYLLYYWSIANLGKFKFQPW